METKVVQRNARTALASSSAFPGKTVEGRNKMLSEKSKSLEPDSSSPAASLSSNKDTRSFSADVARKVCLYFLSKVFPLFSVHLCILFIFELMWMIK